MIYPAVFLYLAANSLINPSLKTSTSWPQVLTYSVPLQNGEYAVTAIPTF